MIVIFALPILTGGLLVHLLWPDRALKNLILKAFLGIGIGLGITSLSYFLYMSLFAGEHWFVAVQAIGLLILAGANVWQERKHSTEAMPKWNFTAPSRLQYVFAGLGGVIFLVSLGSTASYILRRKQGDWDAWMMYNRAARFIYRDQTNWLQSFSRQMDPIFHADYPLFLAMNIASGWDTLGNETPRVPMVQSALFAVACAGLMVSGLAATKTAGQAALGLIIFWGTPAVVNEGARELADLPLAYFFLATGILIYLYILYRKSGLLILAGLTAGLAAWMKNEGSVFVIATAVGARNIASSAKAVADPDLVRAWTCPPDGICAVFQVLPGSAKRCAKQRTSTLTRTDRGTIPSPRNHPVLCRTIANLWRVDTPSTAHRHYRDFVGIFDTRSRATAQRARSNGHGLERDARHPNARILWGLPDHTV